MRVIAKQNNYSEKSLDALCIILWFNGSLMSAVWIFMNKLFHVSYEVSHSLLMPLIVVALIMASLSAMKKRLNSLLLSIFFTFLIIFILSYLIHPTNPAFEELGVFSYCFLILPYLFLGSFFDITRIKRIIYLLSIVVVIKNTLFLFVFNNNTTADMIEGGGEYMSAAYSLLPSVLILFWYALDTHKLFNIALSLYSLFLLLAYGNRGSVLCVVLFVLLYFGYHNIKKLKIWQISFVLVGVGIVIRYLDEILVFFQLILGSLGLSTRFFDMIEGGVDEDASSQGRLYYYSKALKALDSENFMGLGMAGDRIPLNGAYSHNIIVESIVSYGYVFGSLFLLLLFLLVFFAFRKAKDYDEVIFLFVLMCIGLIPLFISGSYVDEILFYLFIGYCTFIVTKRKTVSYAQNSYTKQKVLSW